MRCLHWRQKHFLSAIKPQLDEERYSDAAVTTQVKMEVSFIGYQKSASNYTQLHIFIGVLHNMSQPLWKAKGAIGGRLIIIIDGMYSDI